MSEVDTSSHNLSERITIDSGVQSLFAKREPARSDELCQLHSALNPPAELFHHMKKLCRSQEKKLLTYELHAAFEPAALGELRVHLSRTQ